MFESTAFFADFAPSTLTLVIAEHVMSATALHPKSALPAMEDQTPPRVEKWKTSPGGPLERHVQTSSGGKRANLQRRTRGGRGQRLERPER